jgi:hypothetical protein
MAEVRGSIPLQSTIFLLLCFFFVVWFVVWLVYFVEWVNVGFMWGCYFCGGFVGVGGIYGGLLWVFLHRGCGVGLFMWFVLFRGFGGA